MALDGSLFFQFTSCVGFSHSILINWTTQEIFLSLPEIKLMAFPLGSPNVFPLGISEHTFMPVGIPCYSALDCPDSVTHFENHQCLGPNSFNMCTIYLLDWVSWLSSSYESWSSLFWEMIWGLVLVPACWLLPRLLTIVYWFYFSFHIDFAKTC